MSKYYREAKGFDPKAHLVDKNTGGEQPDYYLMTQWRVQWFNQYCEEHGIIGMIDESQVDIVGTTPVQFWRATASIYMDGTLAGQSTAAVPVIDPTSNMVDPSACQTAATFAKGRALANLGFGTAGVFQDEPEKTFATDDPPIEAVTGYGADAAIQRPVPLCAAQTTLPPAAPKAAAPAQMTADEARSVIVPKGSKYAGKTMGEVMLQNPGYISWVLQNPNISFCKNPLMVAAAKTLQPLCQQ